VTNTFAYWLARGDSRGDLDSTAYITLCVILFCTYILFGSRGSSVGITTGYVLDGPGLIPCKAKCPAQFMLSAYAEMTLRN
jgi:hypothetical protein